MKRALSSALFLAGFVVFFGFGVFFQSVLRAKLKEEKGRFHDWLYLPSSQYVRSTAVGYDHFAADFLWLRVIQVFGATANQARQNANLGAYFDVITDLDPHFVAVYSFGNLALGEDGKQFKEGLAILEKGMLHNPRKYRLPYEAAFFSFWTMNKPELAKFYVKRALKAPDCPPWVSSWTAYFEMKMGRYIAAYKNYFSDYVRYFNMGNTDLSELRYNSLRRVMKDWIVAELRAKAIEFQRTNGRYPTIQELDAASALRDVELPDWPRIAQMFQQIRDSKLAFPESDDELDRLEQSFLHKGWKGIPPNPASDNPGLMGFVIWPGQVPTTFLPGAKEPTDNRFFCTSELEAAESVVSHMSMVVGDVTAYRKSHEGACPDDIRTLFSGASLGDFKEPWGGEWVWDKEKCKFYPSTHPDLPHIFNLARPK